MFFITHGSVASNSSVSLSVIRSRPPPRAQKLEQLHVETQSGDPVGSSVGERRPLWDP